MSISIDTLNFYFKFAPAFLVEYAGVNFFYVSNKCFSLDVNGNQKCSDFGNSECRILGIKGEAHTGNQTSLGEEGTD